MKVAFDWDAAKAASNLSKHGVAFEEAMSVFNDPLLASTPDPDHGSDEGRWITIGEVAPGRLLLVVHTWAEQDIENVIVRIISARRPTWNETRQYREGE